MTPTPRQQVGEDGADGADVAEQVDVEGAQPDIHVGVEDGGVAPQVVIGKVGTDVVQAVNGAELFDGPVDKMLHGLGVGEVEFHGDGAAAGLGDPFGGGGGAGDVDVADGHAGALVGEASGGGRADPGGATGDDECLVLQAAHQTLLTRIPRRCRPKPG
jgi:hypothetical protein